MRKVIGMGETILDIVFRNQQPTAAVPGGSSFNCIISTARAGIPTLFVGETGNDDVGHCIADFLSANHVDASYLRLCDDQKSAVSLAFLDENNDAHYTFYKSKPSAKPHPKLPDVAKDDVLLFGSFYAIAPENRWQTKPFIQQAAKSGAILYYDVNFRSSHLHELPLLWDAIHENFMMSTVVRGSADDFEIMYGERNPEEVYRKHVARYCPLFICTLGGDGIALCTPENTWYFDVPRVETVSTIGAGDNFNAGFIYGLFSEGIGREDLRSLPFEKWERLIDCGKRFAANVCASINNSIDIDFGKSLSLGRL